MEQLEHAPIARKSDQLTQSNSAAPSNPVPERPNRAHPKYRSIASDFCSHQGVVNKQNFKKRFIYMYNSLVLTSPVESVLMFGVGSCHAMSRSTPWFMLFSKLYGAAGGGGQILW